MLSKIGKTVLMGTVAVAGLGFGAQKAAADSFSVSVHTPGVSAGYSNHRGHDSGYVSVYAPPRPVVVAPAPVYYPPAPVVVYRPAPVHVCGYGSRPVSRYHYDECGRRVYYTEYVRYRTCDDYHRKHYSNDYYYRGDYYRYNEWDHGHGHGHDKHYNKHGRGHDRDHDHDDHHGYGRH